MRIRNKRIPFNSNVSTLMKELGPAMKEVREGRLVNWRVIVEWKEWSPISIVASLEWSKHLKISVE